MSQSESIKGSAARNTPQPEESIVTMSNSEMSRRSTTWSPTRFNRNQEKNELQDLNNRFATYIDMVKSLESENANLTQELQNLEEAKAQELYSIKVLFESELKDLRNALDDEVKQKNQYGLENGRITLEVEELKKKLNNTTKELEKTTLHVTQFNELNYKYNQALIDNMNLKDANEKFIKDLIKVKKTVEDSKKELDEEILQRVTIENKLQSMKESFQFKEEVHKKQLSDIKKLSHRVDIKTTDDNLIKQNEYYQSELKKIRQKAEDDIKINKQQISELYDSKIQHLENELERKKNSLEAIQEDNNVAYSHITNLTQKINDLLSSNNDYLRKATDLEQLRELQNAKYVSEIQALNQQLTDMQNDVFQKVQEYQDLMDTKVALDLEINAYRQLLESGERRLSITSNTPVVGSPKAKKRKLFQGDETEDEFFNVISAPSTSDIGVFNVSHSQENERFDDYESEVFHQQGDPQTNKKCVIM